MAFELRSRTDHWRGYWTLLFPHDADPQLVKLLLESIRSESDEEVLHSWGSDLLSRAEVHASQTFVQPLELLYDRNPCGHCRRNTVKLLHELNALPDWVINECRYDSDEGTRAFVASLQ